VGVAGVQGLELECTEDGVRWTGRKMDVGAVADGERLRRAEFILYACAAMQ